MYHTWENFGGIKHYLANLNQLEGKILVNELYGLLKTDSKEKKLVGKTWQMALYSSTPLFSHVQYYSILIT